MAVVKLEKWPETEVEYFNAIRHFENYYSKMECKTDGDIAVRELVIDLRDLLVKRACETFGLVAPHESGRFDWFGVDSDRKTFSIWYEEWQQKAPRT